MAKKGTAPITVYQVTIEDWSRVGGPMGSSISTPVLYTALWETRATAMLDVTRWLRQHRASALKQLPRTWSQITFLDLGSVAVRVHPVKVGRYLTP